MSYETIKLETDAKGIATLTLNQPEKHNAMSGLMIGELSAAVTDITSNNAIRIVVLTGAGKSFCAGGDLEWMQQQFEADRQMRIDEAMKLATMLRDFNELPKPLIGRINGQAYGGGIGMISVCDCAIGVKSAKFALTETRLGLIPATISPYVIARMGEGKARQVFMSGKRFDAGEAVDLGLLSNSVSACSFDAAIESEIEPYLATAPGAVARAKSLARSLGSTVDETVMRSTAEKLADCWEDAEAQEGIEAFFKKHKPSWQN